MRKLSIFVLSLLLLGMLAGCRSSKWEEGSYNKSSGYTNVGEMPKGQ
ncbi:MAG: hypothetical protein M5U26_04430 [Planctomycetota bacterium]|nr:hypothetical protein [Planctomycetota bacterium]